MNLKALALEMLEAIGRNEHGSLFDAPLPLGDPLPPYPEADIEYTVSTFMRRHKEEA